MRREIQFELAVTFVNFQVEFEVEALVLLTLGQRVGVGKIEH